MSILYVIGAGELGLPVLTWAQKEGLTLAVTDKNRDAPGLKQARYKRVCNATDIQAHLRFCTRLEKEGNKVVGVISMTADEGCEARWHVQRHFDVERPTRESVRLGLDKWEQWERFKAGGLPVPESALFKKGCVIKPTDKSGSLGVERFEGRQMVQEKVEGRHIDVNGCWIKEKFYRCGTCERFFDDSKFCVPRNGVIPSGMSKPETDTAYRVLEDASRCIGMTSGPVKADLILTKAGFVIIELTPRFHGEIMTTWGLVHGPGMNPWRFLLRYMATGRIERTLLKESNGQKAIWRLVQDEQSDIDGARRIIQWKRPNKRGRGIYRSNDDIRGYECWIEENEQVVPGMRGFVGSEHRVSADVDPPVPVRDDVA